MLKSYGKAVSREAVAEAIRCDSAEALLEVAEKYDIDLTAEEAEAFLDEMDDIDLDYKVLSMVAGGGLYWLNGDKAVNAAV